MNPTSAQRDAYAAFTGQTRTAVDALFDSPSTTQREHDLAVAFLAAVLMLLDCEARCPQQNSSGVTV